MNKIRNLILTLAFVALASNADAATRYFSSSTGLNSNQATFGCSQANPCHDFKGTTYDNQGALLPGDSVLFLRGDNWVGSEAEVVIRSSGSSGSRITVGDYGTGNKPTFYMAPISTGFVSQGNNVWLKTAQTQDFLFSVTQGEDRALGHYEGPNNALNIPEGTFCRTDVGSTTCKTDPWSSTASDLYVRLWTNADPNTSNVRIANFVTPSHRGFIRTVENIQGVGEYVTFKNLKMIGAPQVGFAASARNVYFEDCEVMGAGQDGVLFESNDSTNNWNSDFGRWYGTVNPILNGEAAASSLITYSAAGGSGHGQGWTTYSGKVWIYNTVVRNNFMAGVDFLDVGDPRSNVTQSGVFNCIIHDNARWQNSNSFDPQIYGDGADNILIANNIVYNAGVQPGATNAKSGIALGTERPTTEPVHDMYVINNFVYTPHWVAINTGAVCYGSTTQCPPDGNTVPQTMRDIHVINNTLSSYQAGTFDFVFNWPYINSSLNNTVNFKNNVIITGPSLSAANYFGNTYNWFDADYNFYFRRGISLIIYGTDRTLAQFKTASASAGYPRELSGQQTNPFIVSDSGATSDAHLQRTSTGHTNNSPAINAALENAYTPPTSWVPDDLEPLIWPCGEEVCGTTSTAGTEDDVATSLDAGFHYYTGVGAPGAFCGDLSCNGGETCSTCPTDCGSCTGVLTNTNVQPATLTVSSVGSATVSFTTANAIPSTGKIKVTFPAGYTINSGSTTTVGSIAGIDGSLSISVTGNVVTLTRSGGTSSSAGAKSFVLSNIKNPDVAGSTGVYAIETLTSANVSIDIDSAVAADIISAGGPTTSELVNLSGISIT